MTDKPNLLMLLDLIAHMETADDIRQIGELKASFYEHATTEEIIRIREAIKRRNEQFIDIT